MNRKDKNHPKLLRIRVLNRTCLGIFEVLNNISVEIREYVVPNILCRCKSTVFAFTGGRLHKTTTYLKYSLIAWSTV